MRRHGKPLTRQVDLNLLELFDTVYRTRSLTAAGERLGLSQPAVSYGLARLREMYGDPLFIRIQRGVAPTPFAEQLAEPVDRALQIIRGTIEKPVFVPAQAQRVFRIAMADIGERYFLPQLCQRLASQAPGVVIQTLSVAMAELSDGLASGAIDLAVGFIPGLGKQVHQQPLFVERYAYLMRNGHPAAGEKLTLAQLRQWRHLVADPPGTHHLAAVEKVLAGPKVGIDIAMRVQSFLCIGPILAETDMVSPVPSNLARVVGPHLNLRTCLPPMKFPEFNICSHWHQRMHQDPASIWLRGVFADLFAAPGLGHPA